MLAVLGGNRWLCHLHINGPCVHPLSCSPFSLSAKYFPQHVLHIKTYLPTTLGRFVLTASALFTNLNLLPCLNDMKVSLLRLPGWKRHLPPPTSPLLAHMEKSTGQKRSTGIWLLWTFYWMWFWAIHKTFYWFVFFILQIIWHKLTPTLIISTEAVRSELRAEWGLLGISCLGPSEQTEPCREGEEKGTGDEGEQ